MLTYSIDSSMDTSNSLGLSSTTDTKPDIMQLNITSSTSTPFSTPLVPGGGGGASRYAQSGGSMHYPPPILHKAAATLIWVTVEWLHFSPQPYTRHVPRHLCPHSSSTSTLRAREEEVAWGTWGEHRRAASRRYSHRPRRWDRCIIRVKACRE